MRNYLTVTCLDDVESAVNCLLKYMAVLVQGERIETRGFGGFDLHHRSPRNTRNPKTGEMFQLPAKVAVHFKPGKDIKGRVKPRVTNARLRNNALLH